MKKMFLFLNFPCNEKSSQTPDVNNKLVKSALNKVSKKEFFNNYFIHSTQIIALKQELEKQLPTARMIHDEDFFAFVIDRGDYNKAMNTTEEIIKKLNLGFKMKKFSKAVWGPKIIEFVKSPSFINQALRNDGNIKNEF